MEIKRGKLIVFEGEHGAGKTVMTNYLTNWIHKKKLPVILTRPTDFSFWHLQPNSHINKDFSSVETELLRFIENCHHSQWIKEQLNKGFWVISDEWGAYSAWIQAKSCRPKNVLTGILNLYNSYEHLIIKPNLGIILRRETKYCALHTKLAGKNKECITLSVGLAPLSIDSLQCSILPTVFSKFPELSVSK